MTASHQSRYQLQQLPELQIPLLNKFYKQCRYAAKAGRGELLFVLKDSEAGQQIVAGVRLLANDHGWYFLRSMCVSPAVRGQGLGSQLLEQMADFLQTHRVYCFPFSPLQSFYTQAGFFLLPPEQAPAFMREPFQRYTLQGRDICLMVNSSE